MGQTMGDVMIDLCKSVIFLSITRRETSRGGWKNRVNSPSGVTTAPGDGD